MQKIQNTTFDKNLIQFFEKLMAASATTPSKTFSYFSWKQTLIYSTLFSFVTS